MGHRGQEIVAGWLKYFQRTSRQTVTKNAVRGTASSMGFVVLLPLFYALMGFLAGVVGAWIYNLLAGWIGGLEFEFEARTPPPL